MAAGMTIRASTMFPSLLAVVEVGAAVVVVVTATAPALVVVVVIVVVVVVVLFKHINTAQRVHTANK